MTLSTKDTKPEVTQSEAARITVIITVPSVGNEKDNLRVACRTLTRRGFPFPRLDLYERSQIAGGRQSFTFEWLHEGEELA